MRNTIFVIFFAVGLLGCGGAPQEVAPRTGYNLIGATVISANEPGWFAIKSNPGGVALGKSGDLQGESRIYSVTIIQVDSSQSDQSFLEMAKTSKTANDNPSRFQIAKASTKQVTFKGARCLQFESSLQNSRASIPGTNVVFENNVGYTCRHPLRKDVAVDMTYSSRSGSNSLSVEDRSAAKRLFSNTKLNSNFFDRL
ncbi:hypothetical protein [Boseongicola aestuarii]|uniref:Lipoprotein n=1 Tax=Boseongicola aestuarii TaxID=1470561 RepID=A0A238J7E3_9RHOB|nr:hypothetical protein [Boseongicola aestuarii]SMX25870.1 hypothetical protein BOA8489_04015 [Boseongicola aestuarii]